MGVDNLARGLAAAVRGILNANANFFNTKLMLRSDTPLAAPIIIDGIPAQYSRIQNLCVANSNPADLGHGILQVKYGNDTKGIADLFCKTRAATIGASPVAIQPGDVVYTQLWYGDAGPTTGDPIGSMAHLGWYRIAIDGAPTGDSTELPGWYGLATGSGFHSPGSRYAFEINSKQQVHFPGRTSAAFGPTITNVPAASYGANFVLGVGDAAAGGAPLKLTSAGAALLTVAEPNALEVDTVGILYWTNAAGVRVRLSADTTAPGIAAGTGAGTSPTIAVVAGPDSGRITLTTGSSPTLNGAIATITYANAFLTDSFAVISPANANAAAAEKSFFATGTAAGFVITNTGVALTASTQYIWEFSYSGK